MARLRGAQAGFGARSFDLKLPPWQLMVTGQLTGPGLDRGAVGLSVPVLERIRAGVAHPTIGAGIAQSLLTQLINDQNTTIETFVSETDFRDTSTWVSPRRIRHSSGVSDVVVFETKDEGPMSYEVSAVVSANLECSFRQIVGASVRTRRAVALMLTPLVSNASVIQGGTCLTVVMARIVLKRKMLEATDLHRLTHWTDQESALATSRLIKVAMPMGFCRIPTMKYLRYLVLNPQPFRARSRWWSNAGMLIADDDKHGTGKRTFMSVDLPDCA